MKTQLTDKLQPDDRIRASRPTMASRPTLIIPQGDQVLAGAQWRPRRANAKHQRPYEGLPIWQEIREGGDKLLVPGGSDLP